MIIYENARFGANYEMEIVNPHVEDYTISHFHRSYEFIYIYKGELVVALDDENVTLREGEYILIFPKQIHSFRAKGDCDKLLVMFSPDYKLKKRYGRIYALRLHVRRMFRIDPQYKIPYRRGNGRSCSHPPDPHLCGEQLPQADQTVGHCAGARV